MVVEETSSDGVTVRAEVVTVQELRRGKIAHERVDLFDESPELTMWGRAETLAATAV